MFFVQHGTLNSVTVAAGWGHRNAPSKVSPPARCLSAWILRVIKHIKTSWSTLFLSSKVKFLKERVRVSKYAAPEIENHHVAGNVEPPHINKHTGNVAQRAK